jgi:hypothetical protein
VQPDFAKKLLLNDVGLLDEAGCDDKTLATLAADHADRFKTLVEAMECPSYARAFALTIANKMLDVAKSIDANSYQEPELVLIGGTNAG